MTQTDTIRDHNDRFRAGDESIPGRFLITANLGRHLADQEGATLLDLHEKVEQYKDFTEDNDPHQEHDFGAFEFFGQTCYWKIDYYADDSLSWGSEDASDLNKTYRLCTIMLASNY